MTPFLPLPKYFDSEWSYAQYRIPSQVSHISLTSASARSSGGESLDEERCVVGWIQTSLDSASDGEPAAEHQLIALTFRGGWYRLSLPSSGVSNSPSSPQTTASSASSPLHPLRARTLSLTSRSDKGKEKDRGEKESRDCTLREFRRFGRWDEW